MESRNQVTDALRKKCATALLGLVLMVQIGCAGRSSQSNFAAPLRNAPSVAGFAQTETQPVRSHQRLHDHLHQKLHHHKRPKPIDPVMALIEGHYKQATEYETEFKPQCLYHYYQAATLSWPLIQPELIAQIEDHSRAWQIYHSSLGKLAILGPKFGRFSPNQGLNLAAPSGDMLIPATYTAFAWQPADFQEFTLVGGQNSENISNYHRFAGVGVPLVIDGKTEPKPAFMRASHSFAATLVLRPQPTGEWTFAFYDPLHVQRIAIGDQEVPIVRDLTAPFAERLIDSDRNSIQGLLRPDNPIDKARLLMIEPYQPGRIPIVFIHGLASDRFTWADMANDIRAETEIIDRYQILAFQYPTGRPFLESAAKLRHELKRLRQAANPTGQDIAFDQMVLVGHSLGGLVAKLQVTYSEQTLWKAVAYEPLDSICAPPAIKDRLGNAFFFDPVPCVRRVVFIATPHLGSSYARRCIGRVTSSLVKPDPSQVELHRKLILANPGVFTGQMRSRIANSVDLLEPDNRLLLAISRLRYSSQVRYHSIIGTGYHMKGGEGDKVVLVKSAEQAGAASQKLVVAKHSEVHRTPQAAAELTRILIENMSSSPIVAPPTPADPGQPPLRMAPPNPAGPVPIASGFRLLPDPETPVVSARN
ncbi:MAG: alpha/beta hydrolase [Planctomycetaceae bacterium]|nr:alpha/beta hydrolase [Planctomycetaceae bacterium]